MTPSELRKKVIDSPSDKGGPSPWLLIVIAVILVGAVGHFIRSAAKDKTMAGTEAMAKTAPSPANTLPQENFQHAFFDDPQADRFAGLVRDFGNETDPNRREGLLEAWVTQIKTDDTPGWLNFLQSASPSDLAQDLSKRLLRYWTDVTPEKASAWLGTLPSGQQLALLDDVAIPWANSNPTNAMNWSRSLSDDTVRRQALAAVAGEVIRSQPQLALNIALDLPAGPQQDDLIRRGVMRWASEDADSAVAWIKQIPAGDLRNQAMSGVAIVWSASMPVDAATLALNELPPGRLLDDTVISIVQRWAQQQPEAATAWANQFPPGPLRDTAMENIHAQIQRQQEESASTETGMQQCNYVK